MLRIRLTRIGSKKKPYYRVVVAERRSRRDSHFVEILGHYSPRQTSASGESGVTLDMERVRHWIAQGAQASDTVHSLIKRSNRAVVPAVAV